MPAVIIDSPVGDEATPGALLLRSKDCKIGQTAFLGGPHRVGESGKPVRQQRHPGVTPDIGVFYKGASGIPTQHSRIIELGLISKVGRQSKEGVRGSRNDPKYAHLSSLRTPPIPNMDMDSTSYGHVL